MEKYIKHRDRVLDYIDKNLNRELTLDELSEVSCYSKFHFSRIFASMMGETVFQYIHRLRLEKAAERVGMEEDLPITVIAYELGFANCASFSKSFKNHFGLTPSQWRRKIREKKQSFHSSLVTGSSDRHVFINDSEVVWKYLVNNNVEVQIRIQELRDLPVIYIRHIGTSLGNHERFEFSYENLLQWAVPRGLVPGRQMDVYGIYHDNPMFTSAAHLRISAALEVDFNTDVSGDVGKMVLQGGKFAVARFRFSTKDEYSAVFEFLYTSWISKFSYKSDTSRYGYICFLNSTDNEVLEVKLNIPVKFN